MADGLRHPNEEHITYSMATASAEEHGTMHPNTATERSTVLEDEDMCELTASNAASLSSFSSQLEGTMASNDRISYPEHIKYKSDSEIGNAIETPEPSRWRSRSVGPSLRQVHDSNIRIKEEPEDANHQHMLQFRASEMLIKSEPEDDSSMPTRGVIIKVEDSEEQEFKADCIMADYFKAEDVGGEYIMTEGVKTEDVKRDSIKSENIEAEDADGFAALGIPIPRPQATALRNVPGESQAHYEEETRRLRNLLEEGQQDRVLGQAHDQGFTPSGSQSFASLARKRSQSPEDRKLPPRYRERSSSRKRSQTPEYQESPYYHRERPRNRPRAGALPRQRSPSPVSDATVYDRAFSFCLKDLHDHIVRGHPGRIGWVNPIGTEQEWGEKLVKYTFEWASKRPDDRQIASWLAVRDVWAYFYEVREADADTFRQTWIEHPSEFHERRREEAMRF